MFSKQTLFNASIRAAFSNQVLRTSGPSICASTNSNQSQVYNILPRNILARFMSDSNKPPPSPMDLLRSVTPDRLENEKNNQSTTFSSGKPTQFLNFLGENSNLSNNLFAEKTNQITNLFPQKSNRSTNLFDENSNIFNNSMGGETNQPTNIMGGYNNGSMNFVGRMINENRGNYYPSGPGFRQQTDSNADIVHIKILRNNTFVTLTDSKGNKKAGASVGLLPGASKSSKNTPQLTAEHAGRIARSMGVKSVVVKVNGFTKFSKKKSAITGFREGYTSSRGNNHPIVYLEDTTRKAHNGCRLPKQKRK